MLSDLPVLDAIRCELCGRPLRQVMVHTCEKRKGELCGPYLDEREHTIGMATHQWLQLHNCIEPEEDKCPFCALPDEAEAGRRWLPGGKEPRRPACCPY